MDILEICYMPANVLASRIQTREISPVEVLDALLARIEQINPAINAIVTLSADTAREAAKLAEAAVRRGGRVGALHGVPILVKDLTLTAGVRTTFGSEIYANHVPTQDASLVERLKNAGAIILGKTNTPEFGSGANTFNNVFGVTRNPWNPALTPAGSSGGSAAALAAGLAPLATGSDLGGSLRTPASFCGVVGLRPTPGRISNYPTPMLWEQLGVNGPMARNVADVALMFSAMAGPDERLPFSTAANPGEFTRAVQRPSIKGAKVAWSADLGFAPMDEEVSDICLNAARLFSRELGCTLNAAAPDLHEAPEVFQVLRAYGMATGLAQYLPQWRDKMQPNLVGNIERGLKLSGLEVGQANVTMGVLWQRARLFFEDYDFLVTPAASTTPFPVETISPPYVGGRKMETYVDWLGITYGITLVGLPAIVVPCGRSSTGMPVGLQIVGRRMGEAALLRAAAAFEQAHKQVSAQS